MLDFLSLSDIIDKQFNRPNRELLISEGVLEECFKQIIRRKEARDAPACIDRGEFVSFLVGLATQAKPSLARVDALHHLLVHLIQPLCQEFGLSRVHDLLRNSN